MNINDQLDINKRIEYYKSQATYWDEMVADLTGQLRSATTEAELCHLEVKALIYERDRGVEYPL